MFGISDVFQAWDVLSGSVLAITGAKSKNANAVDCSYITPAIIGKTWTGLISLQSRVNII
jgi:hypothetical protein